MSAALITLIDCGVSAIDAELLVPAVASLLGRAPVTTIAGPSSASSSAIAGAA